MEEKAQKRQLDMRHGSIWNKIPLFALPVAATAILEQLFNASDVAIVGNLTGDASTAAVAAVGANSPIVGSDFKSVYRYCSGRQRRDRTRNRPRSTGLPCKRRCTPPFWWRSARRCGGGRPRGGRRGALARNARCVPDGVLPIGAALSVRDLSCGNAGYPFV